MGIILIQTTTGTQEKQLKWLKRKIFELATAIINKKLSICSQMTRYSFVFQNIAQGKISCGDIRALLMTCIDLSLAVWMAVYLVAKTTV